MHGNLILRELENVGYSSNNHRDIPARVPNMIPSLGCAAARAHARAPHGLSTERRNQAAA